MSRNRSVASKFASFALAAGAAVSFAPSAHALPHFGFHHHPADTTDTRIQMTVYNKGESFRDVKIENHVYTVQPHQTLQIKAPEGTPVYTDTTGALHRKGDLLFSVSRSMQGRTLSID